MGKTFNTGYLQNIVQYDASNNITLPANLTVTGSIVGYATTSYVTTQINNLINGAPGLLDTLDELAAALGDDANFAATLTTSLAGKQSTLTFTGPLVNTSGTITITQSSGSTNGFLSNTDWTTFNNKQSTLTFSGPLVNTSGTISITQSSGSTNGYLSNTDWTTFNNKQAALSGTGFVKISGTTISYDNSTYLTTASATSTYLPLAGGTLTGPLTGTSASFNASLQLTSSGSSISTTYGGVTTMYQLVDTGGGLLKVDGDNTIRIVTNNVNRFQINSTAATFTTTIGGTTATFSGAITATSFVKTSGTSSQFLKANGTVDSSTYVTTDTTQTISGAKTFTTQLWIGSNAVIGGSNGQIQFDAAASSDLFISCIPGTRTVQIRNGNAGAPNYSACALITGNGTFTALLTGQSSIYQTDAAGLIASNKWGTYNGGSTAMTFSYNTSGNVIWTNSSDRMTLDYNGNLYVTNNVTAVRYYVTTGGNATDPMIRDNSYTSTGIYFPSANAMAITNNGTQSVLFQADGITKISNLRVSTTYTEYTKNLSGAYTSGTYYEIVNSSQMVSGIYVVKAYVDTYAIGGGTYFCTYVSVPFFFYTGGSNNTGTMTFPTMLGSGHAGLNPPIIRLRLSPNNPGYTYLEFDPNANWSNVQGTGGATVTFYVKRIGD